MVLQKKERDECFAIELGECDGGAQVGKIKKCIISIVNDEGKNLLPHIAVSWLRKHGDGYMSSSLLLNSLQKET